MVAAIVAANTILTDNNRMVNAMMGANDSVIDNSGVDTKGLDLDYNKSDYSEDEIGAAEDALADQIADEGIVLLKMRTMHFHFPRIRRSVSLAETPLPSQHMPVSWDMAAAV